MKRKGFILCFALVSVTSLVLGACNYSGTPPLVPPTALPNPEIPAILMRSPYNGSIYSVGATVELETTVHSLNSLSINEVTFLVNGTSIGAAEGEYLSRPWTPSQAGEYYIQSRAVLSDGAAAVSDPVRICVLPLTYGFQSVVMGYGGPCTIPTQIPNVASSGAITINAFASPATLSYSADPACYWNAINHVTFVARVDDPQDLVAFADVDLYLDNATNAYEFFLNWVTTRPVNQKEYRMSTQLGPTNLAHTPNEALRWVIKTFGRDGQELETTEGSIPIQTIECAQQPLQIASPTPSASTSTPGILQIVTATPTPTQKIVYVASPTKKPKKNNGSGNTAPTPQPCNPLVRVCP